MRNTIFLRRKNKLIVEPGQAQLPDAYLATALHNLLALGYIFSQPLIQRVRTLSVDQFTTLYEQVARDLKQMVGAHVVYEPTYPNFPTQVMEASDCELFFDAIIHYLTCGQWRPRFTKRQRPLLPDKVEPRVIDLGTEEEFDQMIRALIRSNTAISDVDKADVAWALSTYENLDSILPDEIPLKENVGFVVATLLHHGRAQLSDVSRYFKTATDVLRLAVSLSGGDVSLPPVPKARRSHDDPKVVVNQDTIDRARIRFRKFSRAERRLLLALLDQCPNAAEDMCRYTGLWKTLMGALHPAEYRSRYPNACRAFDALYHGAVTTFGSQVEAAVLQGDIQRAVALLQTRPGEFARRLNALLCRTADQQQVVAAFAAVAKDVATPVLLQVISYFAHRSDGRELRVIFPKGNVTKLQVLPNQLPPLPDDVCRAVVKVCRDALTRRFAALPPLGRVYVDERLRDYLVPFALRSASRSLRTIVRGSRLPMPEGDTIRFFTWWKEGVVDGHPTGRIDVDLSAVMYDASWQYMEHVSYTNLRSVKYQAVHSGDIVAAPKGACEFIDLHIPSILQYGGRYVVASLFVFSGPAFCAMPEAFAGWMIRQQPGSGEVFEPSTVQDRIDLAADTKICIPVIMDLQEREVIWCDLALTQNPNWYVNIEANQSSVSLMGWAMTTLKKPTLYELFSLHAAARGELVSSAAEADTIFGVHEGITPFDQERIMAEFLA